MDNKQEFINFPLENEIVKTENASVEFAVKIDAYNLHHVELPPLSNENSETSAVKLEEQIKKEAGDDIEIKTEFLSDELDLPDLKMESNDLLNWSSEQLTRHSCTIYRSTVENDSNNKEICTSKYSSSEEMSFTNSTREILNSQSGDTLENIIFQKSKAGDPSKPKQIFQLEHKLIDFGKENNRSILDSMEYVSEYNISIKKEQDAIALDSSTEETNADVSDFQNICQQSKTRRKHYCMYCLKVVQNFARHLKRHHFDEPDVKKFLCLEKGSKQRKVAFDKIRRHGDFISTNIIPVKTKNRNVTDNIVCKFCMGYYAKKTLSRHTKKCPLNPEPQKTFRAQSEGQTVMAGHFDHNDSLKKSGILNMLAGDDISLIAKKDPVICEVARKYILSKKGKYVLLVAKRMMRRLARLLKCIRALENNENITLLDTFYPSKFNIIVNATKSIAEYNPIDRTFKSNSLAVEMGLLLKSALFAAASLEKCRNVEKMADRLTKLKNLIETNWTKEIFSETCQNLAINDTINQTPLIPPVEDLRECKKEDEVLLAQSTMLQNSQLDFRLNPSNKEAVKGECDSMESALKYNLLFEQEQYKTVLNSSTELKNPDVSDFQNISQQSKTRRKHHCVYCSKAVQNFARHLKCQHFDEADVKKFLGLKKGSKQRNFAFDKIRRLGDFISNNIIPVKTKNNDVSDIIACKFCKGYYAKKTLHRHIKRCSLNPEPQKPIRAQSEGQTVMAGHFDPDDPLQKSGILNMLAGDHISLIAKKDPVICEVARTYILSKKGKSVLLVAKRRMRRLARLLKCIRALENNENVTLLDTFYPSKFKIIVNATKSIAEYNPIDRTYKFNSLAVEMGTLLKSALFAAASLEKCRNVEKIVDRLTKLRNLIETNWIKEIFSETCQDLAINDTINQTPLIPPVEDLREFKKEDEALLAQSTMLQNSQLDSQLNPSNKEAVKGEPILDSPEYVSVYNLSIKKEQDAIALDSSTEKNADVSDFQNICQQSKTRRKHNCIYCLKVVQNFARHLKRLHFDEPDVKKFLCLEKGSKQRRLAFDKIRRLGDFISTNIIPVKTKNKNVSGNIACEFCKGYYAKKTLSRHIKTCSLNPKSQKPIRAQNESQAVMVGHFDHNDSFKKSGTLNMLAGDDDISLIAKNDPVICEVAREYILSKKGKSVLLVAKTMMRRLAGLLKCIRALENNENITLLDTFDPSKFKIIVNATKSIAEYNPIDSTYKINSFVIQLGALIKSALNAALSLEKQKQVGSKEIIDRLINLKTLMETNWTNEVISQACQNSVNFNKLMFKPAAEDMKKFQDYLKNTMEAAKTCLIEDPSSTKNYQTLQEAIYCSLLLFNRRSVDEMVGITYSAFLKCDQSNFFDGFDNILTNTERIMFNKLKVMEIKGKGETSVPVLFEENIFKFTQFLVSIRDKCNLHENIYLFGVPNSSSSVDGYFIIKKHAIASLGNYELYRLLTSTRLRKHLATMNQIFSMRKTELERLAVFMGHIEESYEDFYKLPTNAYQTGKMSKILMLKENEIEKYKGRRLNEIDIDDFLVDEENSNSEEAGLECKQEKDQNKRVLIPWTPEQKAITERFFQNHIQEKIAPRKMEVQQLINENPNMFDNKTWTQIKVYVYNRYIKNKKNI